MVSTKNIIPVGPAASSQGLTPFDPFSAGDRPSLFILISVAVHLLVFMAFVTIKPSQLALVKSALVAQDKPIVINMVDLPPDPHATGEEPKDTNNFAQRSQVVKKEEYPNKIMRLPKGSAGQSRKQASDKPAIIIKEQSALPPVLLSPSSGENAPKEAKGANTAEDNVARDNVAKKVLQRGYEITDKKDGYLKQESKAKGTNNPEGTANVKEAESNKPVSKQDSEILALSPAPGTLQQIARTQGGGGVDSPKEGKGMTLLLNTSEYKYQKYFMEVKRRIQFYWDYPPSAARRGQQGRLKIDFIIQRDGTVKDINIVILKSSNYAVLDDAATTALRLASPFNPFPKGFDAEDIKVHGSFEYNLLRR